MNKDTDQCLDQQFFKNALGETSNEWTMQMLFKVQTDSKGQMDLPEVLCSVNKKLAQGRCSSSVSCARYSQEI